MNILTSLGVNWTIFVHIICFAISYIFFTNFILKPYIAAMHERQKRTLGNEGMAVRIIEEADDLQAKYEQKAKALNAEIKGFFDESRTKAMHKYDELITAARSESSDLLKKAQAQVATEIGNAKKSISAEIPAVSATIASKLAGKEISL